jgi:hypothetical protein
MKTELLTQGRKGAKGAKVLESSEGSLRLCVGVFSLSMPGRGKSPLVKPGQRMKICREIPLRAAKYRDIPANTGIKFICPPSLRFRRRMAIAGQDVAARPLN